MQKTKLENYLVYYQNKEEYHSLKKEVFTQNIYFFETDHPQPTIIDVGANIGLSCLYFKKLYPNCKILALEPLETNYQLLERNIFENGLSDVETKKLALAKKEGEITLHTDQENNWHSTASVVEGNWTKTQRTQPVQATATTLELILKNFTQVDLLKLDIEGAEQEVLLNTNKESLKKIKQIMCEFHPHQGQNLLKLGSYLKESSFSISYMQNGQEIKEKNATGLVVLNAYH